MSASQPYVRVRVVATIPLECCHTGGDTPCLNPPTRIRFFRRGEAATYCDLHQELAKRPEYGAIGEARLDVR